MRKSDQLESLQKEVESLRRIIQRHRQNPSDIPFTACDQSCICARPEGMATNGGCRCDEQKLRRVVIWLWRKVKFLEETIHLMRSYVTCPHTYDVDDKGCALPMGHTGPHGTIDEIGESHERWRNKASDRLETIQHLLAGMNSRQDILRKFSVTEMEATALWEEYRKL